MYEKSELKLFLPASDKRKKRRTRKKRPPELYVLRGALNLYRFGNSFCLSENSPSFLFIDLSDPPLSPRRKRVLRQGTFHSLHLRYTR